MNTSFSSVIGKDNENEVLQMNTWIPDTELDTELSYNATTFAESSENEDGKIH